MSGLQWRCARGDEVTDDPERTCENANKLWVPVL